MSAHIKLGASLRKERSLRSLTSLTLGFLAPLLKSHRFRC